MEKIETTDNGEIDVQIAPIGQFNGSDSKGNPVPENLTSESLKTLADKLNEGDEILCDVDHQSCRPGVEKDTSSAGWFSKFVLDPVKGLFARLKLTKRGKELIENREYRYLSPTFSLGEDGTPVDLHSVSLTNLPAFKGHIKPILNQSPEQKETLIMEITKEELVQLIKDVIAESAEKPEETEEIENSCGEEEKKEETKNEEPVEEKKEDVEDETKEDVKDETKEDVEDEKKDEIKEEEEEEEKKEVIKEDVLNSAPAINVSVAQKPEWENLHGKAFFDCLKKNGYRI